VACPNVMFCAWPFPGGARTRALIVALASGGALSACDNTVKLPQTDTTPPSATLTAFQGNIGSVFGSNVHLQETGQNVSRKVGLKDTVEFLGVGEDNDGGVRRVVISEGGDFSCDLGNGKFGTINQIDGIIGKNEDPSNPTPGTSVPRSRSGGASIAIDHGCSPQHVGTFTAEVSVQVENYYGLKATTKILTLSFP